MEKMNWHIKRLAACIIIAVALVVTATAIFPNRAAATDEVALSTLNSGDTINFAGYTWIVLNPSTGYLVMQGWYGPNTGQMFGTVTNVFNPDDDLRSNIGYYLNHNFYNSLPVMDRSFIQNHTWTIGDKDDESAHTVDCKVCLISRSEFNHYKDIFGRNENRIDAYWWTRTPYNYAGEYPFVCFVDAIGWNSSCLASDACEVRPALYIDPGTLIAGGNGGTVVRSGPADPDNSTFVTDKATVIADGTSHTTLLVTLRNSKGELMKDYPVSLKQNSGAASTITAVQEITNSYGQALFNVSDTNIETVTYTASDAADNVDLNQNITVNFILGGPNSHDATVIGSDEPADGKCAYTIKVTLKDALGRPVPGCSAYLRAAVPGQMEDSKTVSINPKTGNTDSNGSVTFTITDRHWENLDVSLVASTEQGAYSKKIANISFINKSTTSISVDDVLGMSGRNATLNASLSSNGTPIANQTVRFTIDGKEVGSGVTDINGAAKLQDVVLSGIAPGTHSIGASFASTDNYTASNGSGTLTVSEPTGDVLTVSNTNDSGIGSLRQAILDALPGNTIRFADSVTGAITLESQLPAIDKDLTIIGPGTGKLTVSGNNQFRVFRVNKGNMSISNITIKNGYAVGNAGEKGTDAKYSASYGAGGGGGGGCGACGGLLIVDGSVAIDNVNFSGNNATGGAGGEGGQAAVGQESDGHIDTSYIIGTGGAGGAGGKDLDNSNGGNGGQTYSGGSNGGNFSGGGGGGSVDNYDSNVGPAGGSSSFGGGNGGNGGIRLFGGNGGNGGDGYGGAIFINSGSLTISNSMFSGNTVKGGEAGDYGYGWNAPGGSRYYWYGGAPGSKGNSKANSLYNRNGTVTVKNVHFDSVSDSTYNVTIPSYTVTFDKNGGDTGANPGTKSVLSYGTVVTLPAPPARAGYSFSSWNTDKGGNGIEFTGASVVSGDTTVYAQWTALPTYTVTFDKNGGDNEANPITKTAASGCNVGTLPASPSRTDYTFNGWNTQKGGGGTQFNETTAVNGSTTVYAQWTALPVYTVTFNKNGGDTEANPSTKAVTSGMSTGSLPIAPTKAGYTFRGWYTGQDGSGTEFVSNTPVTGPLTVYAKWEKLPTCTVTFDRNDGGAGGNAATATIAIGESTGNTAAPISRQGYKFIRWDTSQDGKGTEFKGSTHVNEDTTVYAQWVKTYTVSFDKNCSDNITNPSPITVVLGEKVGTLPTALSRGGYRFDGWYTNQSGDGDKFSADAVINGDITAYAKWTAIYTVTFDKNGGDTDANPASKTVFSGETITTLPASPTCSGYRFKGWYSNRDGDGEEFKADKIITDNTTVYAQWIKLYKVTFDRNGGDGNANPSPIIAASGEKAGTLPPAITRSGYKFSGWYANQNGTGDEFTADTNITGDITIFAKWIPLYTVTFDRNGGDGSTNPSPIIAASGEKADTLPPAITRSGYKFGGWYANQNGTGDEFTADTNITGDITVYAKWIQIYTVTFDKNSGAADTNPVTKAAVSGETVSLMPVQPERQGYRFIGWNTMSDDTGTAFTESIPVTGDITVYAQWVYIQHHDNGDSSDYNTPKPSPGTVIGSIIDETTNAQVSNINATVAQDSNGSSTVSMKAADIIVLKQPDGSRSQLTDISKISVVSGNVPVTISSDGTIKADKLAKGTDNTFDIVYDLGNGQKITVGKTEIKVDNNGNVSIKVTLIDPYGIITDADTGKAVDGVKVTLYYADTERNKNAGRVTGTEVNLPLMDGFKPNNNINPQVSDMAGAYGYMVFPNSDYYIVAEKDGYNKYTSPVISVEQDIVKWNIKMHKTGAERIFGQSRVDTAIEIAKKMYANNVSNVVLATFEDYPDALTGSVLAYKLNAPILLIGKSSEEQEKVLSYLKECMNPSGTVYVLGGYGVIDEDIESMVSGIGYKNIKRISGKDRYETSANIAASLGVSHGTPIVLVSGENYPDALSVSSPAASMQYPVLLTGRHGISDAVLKEISEINPGKIYIIGLHGAVDDEVLNQLVKSASIGRENIIRIGGQDRYKTSFETAKYFNMQGSIICAATGENFPDAIAGSVYAAKNKAAVILTGDKLSDDEITYLKNMKLLGAAIFGGEGAVNKNVREQLTDILNQK